MQITKEQYEQMASEISEASVSVWDNELLACEDGIKLDDLWPILDKYLKPKKMAILKLSVEGEGSRKQLADALRLLADDLYSEELEEIYNIDCASYNDIAITVNLKDTEQDEVPN